MTKSSKKYIQCVHNNNKEVTPKETIYAIKKAGFDGVFLQWFNKDWEFSQEKQLELCRELGLEIPFVHLGYKNINCLWDEGDDGDKLIDDYLKDFDICKANQVGMVVMHLTSKMDAKEPNETGLNRIKKLVKYAEKFDI